MNKFALFAAAAITAASGGIAFAQETVDITPVDTDKDGLVSWDEALAYYPNLTEAEFGQVDGNSDGSLDPAEFGALQDLKGGTGDSSEEAPSSAVDTSSSSAVDATSSPAQ